MTHRLDADVAILGMGSAGLLTAVHLAAIVSTQGLSPQRILVIGRAGGGSSVLSSWYVAQYHPETLKQRLTRGLGPDASPEQVRLVEYIADHHIAATERFKSEVIAHIDSGVKTFENGFSGIRTLTGYSTVRSLPGNRILACLGDRADELGVRRVVGNIDDLERIGGGYRIHVSRRSGPASYSTRRLVIATGGMAHTQEIATSARAEIANVLELARDRLNVGVCDLDRAVYFPFALREEGYRAGSLLPPSFMTRADIVEVRPDGSRVDFLSDHLKVAVASGDYRPQFAELVALFRSVRASGSRVLVETRMSREEFEHYKTTDHYGYVFKDKCYEQALSLSVAPAYHSALGGIVVDSRCASTDPRVFAVGEAALVYGTDRPIGGEHVSAITLAPHVAGVLAAQWAAEWRVQRERICRPASGALSAVRSLLDQTDESLVASLGAAPALSPRAEADLRDVEQFVRELFRRVSWRVNGAELQQALAGATAETLMRTLGYRLADPPAAGAWSAGQATAWVTGLADLPRERVLNTLAERLAVSELAAPVKQQLGQPVRDAARESEVLRGAVRRAQHGQLGLVEAVYRHLVLPVSFEIQEIYRRIHPAAGAPGVAAHAS